MKKKLLQLCLDLTEQKNKFIKYKKLQLESISLEEAIPYVELIIAIKKNFYNYLRYKYEYNAELIYQSLCLQIEEIFEELEQDLRACEKFIQIQSWYEDSHETRKNSTLLSASSESSLESFLPLDITRAIAKENWARGVKLAVINARIDSRKFEHNLSLASRLVNQMIDNILSDAMLFADHKCQNLYQIVEEGNRKQLCWLELLIKVMQEAETSVIKELEKIESDDLKRKKMWRDVALNIALAALSPIGMDKVVRPIVSILESLTEKELQHLIDDEKIKEKVFEGASYIADKLFIDSEQSILKSDIDPVLLLKILREYIMHKNKGVLLEARFLFNKSYSRSTLFAELSITDFVRDLILQIVKDLQKDKELEEWNYLCANNYALLRQELIHEIKIRLNNFIDELFLPILSQYQLSSEQLQMIDAVESIKFDDDKEGLTSFNNDIFDSLCNEIKQYFEKVIFLLFAKQNIHAFMQNDSFMTNILKFISKDKRIIDSFLELLIPEKPKRKEFKNQDIGISYRHLLTRQKDRKKIAKKRELVLMKWLEDYDPQKIFFVLEELILNVAKKNNIKLLKRKSAGVNQGKGHIISENALVMECERKCHKLFFPYKNRLFWRKNEFEVIADLINWQKIRNLIKQKIEQKNVRALRCNAKRKINCYKRAVPKPIFQPFDFMLRM